ncbi:MAG TPA: hypothetical protein VGS06_33355 [Streptosporangiaceae bacterium]|nr:hypothetical protein [Streptosporangiaceae bacterium]
MGDLESLFEPEPENENETSQWRLRCRAFAVMDGIGAAAGISLYAVVGIDSVVSWPSNQVLLSDPDLSAIAAVLLGPTWVWLIFSAGMAYDRMRSWRLSQMPARPRICFAAAAVVCVAVVAGGFVLGAAKGAVRILPGPRYQVSTIDPNPSAWTTVPLSQFHLWQASFVREDGPLMVFGLAAATGLIALLYLRREAGP